MHNPHNDRSGIAEDKSLSLILCHYTAKMNKTLAVINAAKIISSLLCLHQHTTIFSATMQNPLIPLSPFYFFALSTV